MVWRAEDPQGDEARKIKGMIVPYTRGRGLDVGCGKYKAYPHMIGVDSGKQYYGQPVSDIQSEGETLPMFADDSMDFVFSSHFLEHVDDTAACLKEWWRMIKTNGHLVLYLPHKKYYPNRGEPGANPDHKHDFEPDDIIEFMEYAGKSGWKLKENEERGELREYSFFQVFQKRSDRKFNKLEFWRKPDKPVLVSRYGAYGDQIMAQSILPGLKEQGYHVTYNTTPRGWEILKEHKSIDAFWIQEQDQVPNPDLKFYWEHLQRRFGRVINLSESIEGALLPLPSKINYHYSHEARHKLCNKNYLEHTHDIADVPHKFDTFFRPTKGERAWAKDFCAKKTGGHRPLILWPLSGSAPHKTWPHAAELATYIADSTDAVICFVGALREQQLEVGIAEGYLTYHGVKYDEVERLSKIGRSALTKACTALNKHHKYTRFLFRCDAWPMRKTLALCEFADLLFGPETGVMNAAGQLDVPKVIMLSHSSEENLTKHWKNTRVLKATQVPCYPCHRMHYDFENCTEVKETKAAACAMGIGSAAAFESIMSALGAENQKAA
jgi:ADP-heptose:LPS heptosyltransferase/predicted SAM-dependent methyltransferase